MDIGPFLGNAAAHPQGGLLGLAVEAGRAAYRRWENERGANENYEGGARIARDFEARGEQAQAAAAAGAAAAVQATPGGGGGATTITVNPSDGSGRKASVTVGKKRRSRLVAASPAPHDAELKAWTAADNIVLFDPSSTSMATGYSVTTNIILGNDYNARIGRIITLRQFAWRTYFVLSFHATSPTAALLYTWAAARARVRVLAFIDKQPNGISVYTPQTLLEVGTGGNGSAFNNLNNRDRFITVWDRFLDFHPWSGAALISGTSYVLPLLVENGSRSSVDEIRQLAYRTVYPDAGTSAVPISGALHVLYFFSVHPTSIEANLRVTYHVDYRLRYTDS